MQAPVYSLQLLHKSSTWTQTPFIFTDLNIHFCLLSDDAFVDEVGAVTDVEPVDHTPDPFDEVWIVVLVDCQTPPLAPPDKPLLEIDPEPVPEEDPELDPEAKDEDWDEDEDEEDDERRTHYRPEMT